MVKHRRAHRGKRGYKKCIIARMRRTKFKTPKAARKAFSRAAKSCRKMKATVRRARKSRKHRKARKSRKHRKAHKGRCLKRARKARRGHKRCIKRARR